MEDNKMKKAYIIPSVEVVEVKASQLLMASKMDVLSGELETPGSILSRESIWDEEEEWDNFEYK